MNQRNKYLPNLLRAIARGTDAQASGHDIILIAAADELISLRISVEAFRQEIELLTRPKESV